MAKDTSHETRPLLWQVHTVLTGLASLYMCLIVFNNVADYDSNYAFVENIMRMSDTFTQSQNWRAIKFPLFFHSAYSLIIIVEAISAFLLISGLIAFIRRRYHEGRLRAIQGMLLALVIWMGIFLAIAGEWFLMWQSSKWNGQNTAFHLVQVFALFLLILLRKDYDQSEAS